MRKNRLFPLLVLALAALGPMGCKNRNGNQSSTASVGSGMPETPPAPQDYIFIGCRPSVGECYNSCPDHRSQARTESTYCAQENGGLDGDVECFCFTGGGGLPPDPEGPSYQGAPGN
jgi:hypothetical protein